MSIRAQITSLPIAIALLVACLMAGGMFVSGRQAVAIMHDRDLDTAQAWLEASIARTHRIALAQAEVIASLPVVQTAVATGNDMALERLLAPGFEHMRDAADVVQMQFHLPPATSLIRIHNLEKRGDDLSAFRQTVVDANSTGQSLSGLERGRAGIGARGVAVVHHEGRPVGTVEVGLDIGVAFLEGLAARSGNEFEFYMLPDKGIDTFDAADRTDYRIGATFDTPPLLTGEDLSRLETEDAFDREVMLAGEPHALRAISIRDYAGDVAGVVTLLLPTGAYGAIQRKLAVAASIAAVVATVLGAGIGLATGDRLGRRFARICTATERLAHGDHDLVITDTGRRDEIGGVSRALKLFQEKLLENAHLAKALKQEEEAARAQEAAERKRKAERALERRAVEEAEARRQREVSAAEARAAQAEKAATEARMREQQDVVARLAEGLEALADGDLTHELTEVLPGEYETLRLDFNRALARLRETLSALDRTAEGINGEVASVVQASDNLSRRTEQNAATLEETAAALDQLTSSVMSAAESATEAKRLIESANRNADAGSDSVSHAVEAMNRIAESSRGISKITGVIDEIAFQTNLLALNAGVEAARAGEAGRGFAVVASEVRALAQRSSEAAREISDLIASSQTEVHEGVDLVGKTGAALDRILVSVREISEQVIAIANSSQEQAAGLGEINDAVNQLDTATQQNAAMFEETSAATSVLNHKTGELVSAIRQFRFADLRGAPDTAGRSKGSLSAHAIA